MDVIPAVLILVVAAVVVGTVAVLFMAAVVRRDGSAPGGAPVAADVPLSEETVASVSGLLAQGRKIQAIKVLRDATGLGLKESAERIDRWSDARELHALQHPPAREDERLRIEAAAVVAASGWHVADAFLREQRGLTAEASRALLDAVS